MAPTDEPVPPADNWLNTHFWEGLHTPKEATYTLRRRTQPVTAEDPLEIDVIYSMRSPYSYIALQRLVWLIWGDQVAHWPAHVKDRFNLDYDTAIKYIQDNPEKITVPCR